MMRNLATLLLTLAACAGPPPTAAAIEQGLALEVRLVSPRVIAPGQHIELEIVLINRSSDQSFLVVKAGDGSELGLREPHVFYTAEIESGDGVWKSVPKAAYDRMCGLFDSDWQKDIMRLRPGERLPLKDWVAPPNRLLGFQEPGRVRLYVHYAYGRATRSRSFGAMQGMPPFEIVSDPIELEVRVGE